MATREKNEPLNFAERLEGQLQLRHSLIWQALQERIDEKLRTCLESYNEELEKLISFPVKSKVSVTTFDSWCTLPNPAAKEHVVDNGVASNQAESLSVGGGSELVSSFNPLSFPEGCYFRDYRGPGFIWPEPDQDAKDAPQNKDKVWIRGMWVELYQDPSNV